MSKDENAQVFVVSVTGPNIEVKLPVSENLAHRTIALIMGGTSDVSTPGQGAHNHGAGGHGGGAQQGRQRGRTPRQAIDEAQAKRSFDKITAVGAMLMDNGAESFTVEDVRAQLRRANESMPKNLHRDMGAAVTAGWIDSDGDNSGAYYVTQQGRAAIESKFSGDAKVKVKRRKTKAKPKKASE